MRLLVFAVVGLLLWMIAYAFSLGGTIGALIFLFVIFNGVLDRWAQPILERLRA
jgi:vacuolar-type H+-ATPase subunit I/STV1